ncbi:MAG TPA: histidine phosphatase family protein [Rhodocyclaceae bacterium]
MASRATLNQVRQGGFVLYMRHGNTDNSKPDRVPSVDLKDCSTQRPLTEEGRQLAAQVGKSIRTAHIPVSEIHVSPLCRAKESAQAAFGNKFQVNEFLMYTSNLTTEEKKPILETTRQLLSAPVAKGSNRVIVAHAPNMADLIGYFVKPEGTVVVIRPKGDAGFEYVASIPPTLWRELLP